MDLGGRTNQETESMEVLMQWLQGCRGTASCKMGTLSANLGCFWVRFLSISNGCAVCPAFLWLYVRASGSTTQVYYQKEDNIKELLLDCSLQNLETCFNEDHLLKIHKSYLINPKVKFSLHRRSSADYDLVFKKHNLPVGRKYVKQIKAFFSDTNPAFWTAIKVPNSNLISSFHLDLYTIHNFLHWSYFWINYNNTVKYQRDKFQLQRWFR